MKERTKLIFNITSLLLTALLLIFIVYGWYVTNTSVHVDGITGLTASDGVEFEETVKATTYYLSGDRTYDTYTRVSDGSLYLTERRYLIVGDSKPTETYSVSERKPFFIEKLLPGEYVDITIGYKLPSKNDNMDYTVGFMDVTGGSFTLDGKTHYATGAFKWQSVSLVSGSINGTVINDFANDELQWINTYNIDSNDNTNLKITTMTHNWQNSYNKLFYTFRIYEDFTEYYRLVGQATNFDGTALLSTLTLNIGYIFVLTK